MRPLTLISLTRCRTPWVRSAMSSRRCHSTESTPDLTSRLQSDLKVALKAKDSLSATTIRSVLAEVYAAQKQSAPETIKASHIITIVRKAEQRRLDSMRQFESASRPDLAEREQREATLLAAYLPTTLSTAEIDTILNHIIADISERENPKKAKGLVLKAFYNRVDKNEVLGEVVKQRLDELWSP